MSQLNLEFKSFWNSKYPKLPAWEGSSFEEEFRPQKELYDQLNPDIKYREWLSLKGFSDYRADFALRDYALIVEFDGSGMSHCSANGIERDRQKNNQMLKLGYIMLRYPVGTLKSSKDYIAEEIYETWRVWFEI